MVRVILHGEVGSLDEVALGLGIAMVLVVDALIILAIWRTDAAQRTKIVWTVVIFLTHVVAWAAYALARANGRLQPRARPPA